MLSHMATAIRSSVTLNGLFGLQTLWFVINHLQAKEYKYLRTLRIYMAIDRFRWAPAFVRLFRYLRYAFWGLMPANSPLPYAVCRVKAWQANWLV